MALVDAPGPGSTGRKWPRVLSSRAGLLLKVIGEEAREVAMVRLKRLDLSGVHYGLMGLLEENAGISQLEAARMLYVDPATLVSVLDELETRGLVERRRNPDDRRKNSLQLTDEGRALLAVAHDEVGEAEREFFAPLSDAEHRQLIEFLHRLDRHGVASDPVGDTPARD